MSLDPNDEILQDFLVEASELLESLNEQLVELEQSPEDTDLLNAVFRNFHTIKGGASFLGLDNLVTVCHRAEDVFNLLRNGELVIDTGMMDSILQVLDVVNAMFEEINGGEEPSAADPELIRRLEAYASGAGEAPAAEPPAAGESAAPIAEADAAEAEFEAMLEAAAAEQAAEAENQPQAPAASEGTAGGEAKVGGDEITDEEFEALLDQLHGPGGAPKGPAGP